MGIDLPARKKSSLSARRLVAMIPISTINARYATSTNQSSNTNWESTDSLATGTAYNKGPLDRARVNRDFWPRRTLHADETSMIAPDTLLIDHGDLASLTLVALQADPSRVILWHPRASRSAVGGHLKAVSMHAEIIGRERLVLSEPTSNTMPSIVEPPQLRDAQMLLRAASHAMHMGCSRILWPVHVGPDHARIAAVLEQAATITELADPGASLLVDAPIVELTDSQLVELADDAGAPMRAFWPCDNDELVPCQFCDGCSRWQHAFNETGIEWPWSLVSA
jgi:7-cyano-7-deazaguanine synthase in queuosine biosynthesis